MDKKKKPTKAATKKEAPAPTYITQVVEVVELEEKPGESNTVSEKSDNDTGPAVEREEVESSSQADLQESEDKQEAEEAKQKQVVEELFSKPQGEGLTEISVHKKRSFGGLFLWASIVVVVALVTGGGLFVFSGRSIPVPMLGVSPTPTPTLEPTPTPQPPPNREDVKIQVLNGGGTPGAGSKMRKYLEDKGYDVVDVGNTEEYSYETTIVSTKAGKEAAATLISEDLKEEYELGTGGETVPDDAEYDARVIVGV